MLLNVFPAYGLENSLLTAILVGLYIRFFFNEWLGWVFSGLVVPGYLACIVLLRPASALVIIVEAIITVMLVRGLSNTLSRTRLGSPLFGRDRFVWLVVTSVGIRVAIEALAAPFLEHQLRARLGWDPADSFGFYGIGMVLVPLLANACWKPGLVRGAFQQFVCTGITYLIILALLHTTNLSFAKVQQGFDQLALDFTASPKAYILLLAGVLVASRANLRFGWDTSGVIIPGLLALGWFAPVRIVATIGEALLIVLCVSLFVRLPRIRDWNIEGPRRIVLLFTFGYIIKFCIIAIFGASVIGFEPTALFGIGYLLPSLLAVKILQKRNPALILFPSIGLSLIGVLVGSLAGYALLTASAALQAYQGSQSQPHEEDGCGGTVDLVSEIRLARARIARSSPSADSPRLASRELRAFSGMLRQLRTLTAQEPMSCSQLAAQIRPGSLGLRLRGATSPAGRSFVVLHEDPLRADSLRGYAMVALAGKPTGGPILVVERPQQDVIDLAALASLIDVMSADAIVIGTLPVPEVGRGDTRDRGVALRVATDAIGGSLITIRTQQSEHSRIGARISAPITKALEAKLGPLTHGGAGIADSELVLTPESERTLSAPLTPTPVRFPNQADWIAAVPVVPRVAQPQSAFADLLLAEEVIRPLARARAPIDLAALGKEVSGAAGELGLSVALIDADGPRPRIALTGHGEGLLLDPHAAGGALIDVVSRRLGVAELGSAIFDAQEAHALLIAVTIPGMADAGPLARVAAPILALTPPLPPAIVVRAGSTPTPDCAVISDTPANPPPLAQKLSATLDSLGIRCEARAQYDLDITEPPGRLVDILRARVTDAFVTLHVGPELREHFRPAPLSPAQLVLFARLKVPALRASVEQSLVAVCADRSAQAASLPEALLRDAQTFATTRHPAIIERLRAQAEKEHLQLSVVDDINQAEAYFLLTGRGGAAAVPLRTPATPAVSLPCNRDVAANIRQAQSMGAASIAVGYSP